MRGNPVQKRIFIEGLKRIAGSMLGSMEYSWRLLGYALLILIATSWFPEGFTGVCKALWKCAAGNCFSGAVAVSILADQKEALWKFGLSCGILTWMYWRLKRQISLYDIEVHSQTPAPVKYLLLFLSPMGPDEISEVMQDPHKIVGKRWEMPYLAIRHHLSNPGRLERLFVITSSGEKGTTGLFPSFQKFVKQVFPGGKFEIEELPRGGIDFEDIEGVFKLIEDFYKRGFKEGDILVDITGGQKTNSIAGALVTLSTGRRFQYISTKDKQVRAYDVGYFKSAE